MPSGLHGYSPGCTLLAHSRALSTWVIPISHVLGKVASYRMQVQDEPNTIGKVRCCQLLDLCMCLILFLVLYYSDTCLHGSQIHSSLVQSGSLQSSISDICMSQQLFALIVGKECD